MRKLILWRSDINIINNSSSFEFDNKINNANNNVGRVLSIHPEDDSKSIGSNTHRKNKNSMIIHPYSTSRRYIIHKIDCSRYYIIHNLLILYYFLF